MTRKSCAVEMRNAILRNYLKSVKAVILWQLILFRHEQHKWDQNLCFIPLSERKGILDHFTWVPQDLFLTCSREHKKWKQREHVTSRTWYVITQKWPLVRGCRRASCVAIYSNTFLFFYVGHRWIYTCDFWLRCKETESLWIIKKKEYYIADDIYIAMIY